MKKRRIQTGIVLATLLAGLLSGCGRQEETAANGFIEEGQSALVNIAYSLPRGGEAQMVGELMLAEAPKEEGEKVAQTETAAKSEPAETIRVAAVGSLNEELLKEAEIYMEKQGYGLEIVSCEDYETPNTLLVRGEVEANFFQHSAYLERYNQQKDTGLTKLGAVYYEPLGIYPGRVSSLTKLPKGVRIGVPANPTGYARALLLLQKEGLLELTQDVDLMAVWEDVSANPYELELVQMEEKELLDSVTGLDMAVFSTGHALEQGLDPAGFLALEASDSMAAASLSQILVVNEAIDHTESEEEPEIQEESETEEENNAKSAGLLLLLEILRSEEMKEVVSKRYQDSIIILD